MNDLQYVSIDPLKTKLAVKKQTTIVSSIKNNGPDDIVAQDAKIHITVNGTHSYKPKWVSSKGWKLEKLMTGENGNHEIFATNFKKLGVNDPKFPLLKFTIQRKSEGIIDITGASTVKDSSDGDGANQSASTQVE